MQMLLELFSEEIPARMQAGAASALEKLVLDGLAKNGLSEGLTSRTAVTPRRLVLVVDGLPEAQPDVAEERKGPRADAPEKAMQGFLTANGVTLEQCEKRETPKGTFLFVTIEKKGRPTAQVLKDIVEEALAALPWPKSMRWADNPARWVRPLHSIICLFGGEVVPVEFARVTAGNTTRGHRFLAPAEITVTDYDDYAAKLRAAKVLIDPAERAEIIRSGALDLCRAQGLELKSDEGLLREVAGLVEWPVVLMGRIDRAFMDVPDEVLTTSMRSHQKYFSVLGRDGNLAPHFIVVSNMASTDGGRAIVAGNERVLRARLSDAKFFWDQDRKSSLESRVEKLKERVFHAKLGTDWDKVQRIRALSAELAEVVGAPAVAIDRAAMLAKADLTTGMVGEFPELQGVMGRYYALNDREPLPISDAVAEHYSPLGPSDACPKKPASIAVALADKIDTLVGFWGIDEKPTGSKDPFALRRSALGVIRLILENGLRVNLTRIFAYAFDQYPAGMLAGEPKALAADLLAFFADRLKVHLREQGVRHDLVAAVFELGGEDDLVRLLARVDALTKFLGSDDGANLLVAYRRAANIVRIEDKKDGPHNAPVAEGDLEQDEEKVLAATLATVEGEVAAALAQEDFAAAMGALARLRGPVDAFFDRVTVNADDARLRANRLRLLSAIGRAMGALADFSKVEG
ncbi:glycine--tRNA ligase subunit beta [Novispirillum sp. DQ9]|uniref:glycine--tRNA ligase subunit beta n=1 Tax=Novispirillum sp. DQ9 TaxID=3398612 RepID=UPI003C7C981C